MPQEQELGRQIINWVSTVNGPKIITTTRDAKQRLSGLYASMHACMYEGFVDHTYKNISKAL